MATVFTDKPDYNPGQTALITTDGFLLGSNIKFQVQHILAGLDGVFGVNPLTGIDDDLLGNNNGSGHLPWIVTDGDEANDLDKSINGSIQTLWYVNPDDSLNETFLLTATGAGADGEFGTSDDEVATSIFTDSAGTYTLKWTAADPAVNKAPYLPTYTKISPAEYLAAGFTYPSGRADLPSSNPIDNAVAYGPTFTSSDLDAVTSLTPKDMALGQIVPFEMIISVNGDTAPENGVITFTTDFLAKTTSASNNNFGFDTNYKIIAAFVDTGDAATVDPGSDAKVDSFSSAIFGTGTNNERIQSTVQVSGLNNGDNVVVELWAVLKDTITSGVTGNVQTSLVSAYTGPIRGTVDKKDEIGGGSQIVPLNKVGEFFTAKADLSVVKSDSTDASTNSANLTSGSDLDPTDLNPGDTFTYTILAKNNSTDTVANGVVVTDTLDANVTFVSVTGGGVFADNGSAADTVTWNVGSLNPGETQVLTVTVRVNDNAPTGNLTQDLLNSVSITAITQDPTPGNNTNTEPTNLEVGFVPNGSIAIIKTTNGTDGPTISEGETVTWTYTVSNTGNVDLSNIQVVDDNGTASNSDDFKPTLISGDDGDDRILGLNEVWTFQATGVAYPVNYSNIGTASGEYLDSANLLKTVDSSDPSSYVGENVAAKITIDKSGPATISEGGANVIYNFTITADATNASTDPVTVTSLSDNTFSAADNTALFAAALEAYKVANPSATAIVLNPGESLSFSFDPTGNLELNAGEKHTNTVTVEGKDDDEGTPTISDTDDHTVTGEDVAAKITIDKSGPATISEGEANVIYNFTITADATNASTDPVTVTSLSDNTFSAADNTALFAAALEAYKVANPSATAIVLNPGESLSFSFDPTGNLELNAGEKHTNTVTVEGKDDDEGTPTISDTDDHTVTGEDVAAKITIDKSGPATISEGEANVIYNFTITADATNASTDPVTVTSLSDNTFSAADNTALFAAALEAYKVANPSATAIVLNPGESLSFSFDPTGDLKLNAGEKHTNTVTVEGKDDDEGTPTISDTDDHTVTGEDVAAKITIDKSGPATISEGGANVIYNFTITADATNASTDPVTVTSLSDNTFSAADNTALFAAALEAYKVANPSATAIVLNPGESLSFSFDPTGDLKLNAGEKHTNTVTVEGKDDDEGTPTISDTDDHTVTGEDVAAKITIDKSGPATISEGGANVIYNFTITADATNASTDPVTVTSLSDNTFSAADNTALFAAALEAYKVANPSATAIVLNPGESLSFSFDPTGDLKLNAGEKHTNTVTVEGKDDDEGTPTISDTDDHTVTGENVAAKITIDKSGPATISEGGANVIYNFTITADATNASTDPVTVTSLSDNTFSAADNTALFAAALEAYKVANPSATAIVLNPGESLSFSFDPTGNLELNAGEKHTNTVTVEGKDDDEGTPTISDTDDHTVTGEDVAAKITIDKSGPATISEGEANVIYNFTITADATNASTDPVTVTSLSDNTFSAADNTALFAAALEAYKVANPSATAIVLNPGESLSFSFDPTGDLELNAGEKHTNTVTVEGKDDDEGTPTISDTDDHTVTALDILPEISVIKTVDVNGDGNASTGTGFNDSESVSEGIDNKAVTYRYAITSHNAEALSLDSLSDDKLGDILDLGTLLVGSDTNSNGMLDQDETWVYTLATTIAAGNVDSPLINEVTAEASDDDDNSDTETDTAKVTFTNATPTITVDKLVDANGDNIFHDMEAANGNTNITLTYQYTITAPSTNVSTDPITVSSVIDDKLGDLTSAALVANGGNPIVLNPDESFTFTYTKTGVDLSNVGTLVNKVTVNGHDDENTAVSDTDTATVIKSGYVTNSALSEFDTNSAVAGQQFNLIATPTPWISSGTYKVTDSNPGQFYYNAFATGNAGDIAHIKLNIPYPFVTQGATPIHVYSGVDIHTDSNGMISFDPVGEIAISKEQIAISSFTDTNGDGKIGFGDIYTASLDVTVPASGFIYANIHLDYGLEKTGPWTKFVDSTGGNDMKPGSGNPYQTIEDFGSYGFSSLINSVLGQDTIQNQNIFKNLKGVGGFIHTADDHNPIGGQNVILLDSKGSKVGSATTDADGWEFMTVSAPGKSASYTAFWDQDKDGVKDATEPYQNITWGGPTKFVEVNFDYIVGSNPTIDALL